MARLQEKRGLAYIGTMGWSYSFWAGKLYPESTKQNEYLREYAKHFNSVEVDATFYRIPSIDTVRNWANKVPEGFRFAAKFPQSITHARNLTYDPAKLEIFLERVRHFGEKLGPLLLQLPPYTRLNIRGLTSLLDSLPPDRMYAIEFRDSTWHTEEVLSLLTSRDISLTVTNKQATRHEFASHFGYFRWEGDREEVNGERGVVEHNRSAETAQSAKQVKRLLDSGRDVYGYFSKYYSGYPPHDAGELVSTLALRT